MQYQNRIAIEFNHLYHWHPFLPDIYQFGNTTVSDRKVIWNNSHIYQHGVAGLLQGFSVQHAGEANGKNFGLTGQYVAKSVIEHGRNMRFQPLNEYRKLVGLEPFKSFEEMNSNPEILKHLHEMYQDVDALEFFPGLFIEPRREGGLFGATVSQRGIPSTFQGVFGHPLISPKWFKPSTFGGRVGWELVKHPVDLRELICRNLRPNQCEEEHLHLRMKVPLDAHGKHVGVDPHPK